MQIAHGEKANTTAATAATSGTSAENDESGHDELRSQSLLWLYGPWRRKWCEVPVVVPVAGMTDATRAITVLMLVILLLSRRSSLQLRALLPSILSGCS